ncbi:ATP-dependent helicase HrpB [Tessaracoccus terricola]
MRPSTPSPGAHGHRFDLRRIGDGLVVPQAHDELVRAAAAGAFVVTAPPGTGKSTYVPPLLANHVASTGKVLVTQPRRVAVRAAARRIAQLDGIPLGGPVGFTVRGERTVGPDTRIEVLTPGVLLRRLLSDPALEGVDAVVLDEVHERSLDGDLLLGMLAEVRTLREDLLLVAMSATLDAAAVATLLGGGTPTPVVDVPAALHPLALEYRPAAAPRLDARGLTREFIAHVAEVAATAQAADGVDALVFLPSARDVDAVVRELRERTGTAEVLPLHGRLPAREQDRATQGRTSATEAPRIVVSTALAESSLTVPGVHLVVDAGLSREVRRDRARDMTGLVTVSASRHSVDQRAGRAARQGPGRAVRLFTEDEYARLNASAPPEISSADLVDTTLLMGVWGAPAGAGLELLTPPPEDSVRRAVEVLRSLDLTDGDGRPTPLGRRVAGLPIGARETRALLAGAEMLGDPRAAAEVVAAISDDHRDPDADLPRLLRDLRAGRAPGTSRWRREVKRLTRIAASQPHPQPPGEQPRRGTSQGVVETTRHPQAGSTTGESAGLVVALGRPEWIARRTADHSRTYLLASGTRAALPEGSGLRNSQWLAVHEVQRAEGRVADGTGAVIRMAAPLTQDEALDIGAGLLTEVRSARMVEGRVRVRSERRLGQIILASTPVSPEPRDVAPAFATHLREHSVGVLDWRASAESLRARLALVHRELGPPWPAMDDDSLLSTLDEWLGPDLAGLGPTSSLRGIDVTTALRRLLPWPEASRLAELVPERLAVPSGTNVRIDYPADGDGPPVVAVKLQEVFGLATTPRLVDGRVPVLFHLLSPAHRPLAVTADLESFWNGPYRQVRSEMRGRYPKHPWPEDPWTAPATARTKRRAADSGQA